MTRPKAVPTEQIRNERVIVTEWRFAPGAETGANGSTSPSLMKRPMM